LPPSSGAPNLSTYKYIAVIIMNMIAAPPRYSTGIPITSACVATVGPKIDPICAPATMIPKFFFAKFTSTDALTSAQ
jgi:hypothetical protein